MSKLLELMPLPYRWLAMLALVAAFAGYFYFRGYEARDESADRYEAKVQALADAAARHAGEVKAAQDQNTKELRNDHQVDVGRIRAYYDRRLRDAAATGRAVSASTDSPGRADGPTGEPAPCRADPDARIPLQPGGGAAAIEFERACALDAERLMKWQDFARRNGLPVR